jgi:hydroxymethylpyrimidine pyrophosphatase-like HAD family hydrolase
MSRERAKLVLDKVKEYDAFPSVRHNGRSFVNKKIHNDDYYREHRLSDNCRRFIFETNNAIDDFYDFVYTLDKVEMICTYFKYDSEKDECRKYFEGTGELSVAASEPYNIEMSDLSSGKGKALLALADKLGVDRKATIAVGDSKNDRNAIELAGLGLVMSNGTKELKEIADRVICSNEENVVEYLVREYFS